VTVAAKRAVDLVNSTGIETGKVWMYASQELNAYGEGKSDESGSEELVFAG
jgi:hypothetical protein